MDATDSNEQFSPESDDRLISALFGLGYSQGYGEPMGCSPGTDNDDCLQAIKAFRRACRWDVNTHADTSVRLELARQVDALQHKLNSLDCFLPTQSFTPGHYDAATHDAVARAEEKYGEPYRETLEARVSSFKILTKYTGFDEPDAHGWLNRYVTALDFEALRQTLIELEMLDPTEVTGDHLSQVMKNAALACHHYFHQGLHDSRCGICGPAMREFLARQPPFTFDDVLHQELAAIQQARSEVGQHFGVTSSPRTHPRGRAHEARLMGLAFSGGGIRSATFNLGVLQALAREGLLRRFDYLSSVSGGGYISGWLHAWVKREANEAEPAGILKVESTLGSSAPSGNEHAGCANDAQIASQDGSPFHEPAPVAWLRRYSNYLTPKLGPLGADTLSAVATWLRNVLLNQLLLFLLAIPILFSPWILTRYMGGIQNVSAYWHLGTYILGCVMLVTAASLAALITSERNPWREQRDQEHDNGQPTNLHRYFSKITSQKRQGAMGVVQSSQVGAARLVIVAACLASLLIGFSITLSGDWSKGIYLFPTMFLAYALPAQFFLLMSDDARNSNLSQAYRETRRRRRWQRFASGIAGGLLFALLMLVINANLPNDLSTATGRYPTVILAPPLIMAALLLAAALHIGVAGRSLRESAREWWSRVGGILLRTALLWLLLSTVAIYAAYGVGYVRVLIYALGVTWIATTIGGLFAGRSTAGNGRWLKLLMHMAPYVFIAGLVILLSWGLHGVMVWGAGKLPGASDVQTKKLQQAFCPKPAGKRPTELAVTVTPVSRSGETTRVQVEKPESANACNPQIYAEQADTALLLISDSLYKLLQDPLALHAGNVQLLLRLGVLLGLPLLFLGLAALLGLSIDVNVFALHMFYRNRLERCYLGASNDHRREDPYTDLDPKDSPKLAELTLTEGGCGQRPYPLINTALNLTRSDNLAWQERKAGSFIFTPQFCGYQLPGGGSASRGAYQQTEDYVRDIGGWLSLSTPVTISGAAASPNAGYHTSAALAALMTVFDIRLGMWIQNSGQNRIWRQPGPKQSLRYLLNELTSSTHENSDFVYVSDGGHFENLALYELVRRRCRYIIVCDAGCDPDYSFEDLGNAIRNCKVDLGIDIEIDTRGIKPDPTTGLSRSHCAVGTINYERVDPTRAVAQGYLLYVKASMTGSEPADVGQYAAQHPAFPHESTGDQWYTESQFESYRTLGLHAMSSLLADAISDERRERHRRGFGIGKTSRDRVDEIMYEILNPEKRADTASGRPHTVRNLDREVLFKRLSERWYRPGESIPRSEEHEQALQSLLTQIGDNPRLRFLDHQLFPEWSHLTAHLQDDDTDSAI
ncbi:MAG: patatin-like phospholipase family protein, partial [Candidatus Thiodiazotropha sp.]